MGEWLISLPSEFLWYVVPSDNKKMDIDRKSGLRRILSTVMFGISKYIIGEAAYHDWDTIFLAIIVNK